MNKAVLYRIVRASLLCDTKASRGTQPIKLLNLVLTKAALNVVISISYHNFCDAACILHRKLISSIFQRSVCSPLRSVEKERILKSFSDIGMEEC